MKNRMVLVGTLVLVAMTLIGQSSRPNTTVSLPDGSYPGEIRAFAFEAPPLGWIECDGRPLKRSEHKRLVAAIGTNWGGAGMPNGETFKIPDLRGQFLRGWDHAASNDPNHSARQAIATNGNAGNHVGSMQSDEFGRHSHAESSATDHYLATHSPAREGNDGYGNGTQNARVVEAQLQSKGGDETRPKNVYVMFCIRDAN
jgi:microcystin-dependent protein